MRLLLCAGPVAIEWSANSAVLGLLSTVTGPCSVVIIVATKRKGLNAAQSVEKQNPWWPVVLALKG